MSILIFLIVFALTIFLQRWLHRHIQGFGLVLTGDSGCAVKLLFYLLLPGIILHEASHYLAAKILLVDTFGVKIGVGKVQGKNKLISLGSVGIRKTDPFRESLIGIAPFVMGIGAILAIAGWGFDLWPNTGLGFDQVARRVADYAYDWLTWLDVYLVFAVSTAMIPSESDREPWGPVITILGWGIIVLFLIGWTPRIPPDLVQFARQVIDALTFALGIAVAVNSIVAIVLWIAEKLAQRLK